MKRATSAVILCAVLLCLLPITVYADNRSATVYITNTGTKYHKSGCSYLKSSHAVTLEYAITNGYSACSRCHPPSPDFSLKAVPKDDKETYSYSSNYVQRNSVQKEKSQSSGAAIIGAAGVGGLGFILGKSRRKK